MQKYPIRFNSMEDVSTFVKLVNQFECDIDLQRGSVIIDAKSFLGVMTISGNTDLEMVIHGNQQEEVLTAVEQFLLSRRTA
jgi:phosphotransferase system HPr (HPr) family protein